MEKWVSLPVRGTWCDNSTLASVELVQMATAETCARGPMTLALEEPVPLGSAHALVVVDAEGVQDVEQGGEEGEELEEDEDGRALEGQCQRPVAQESPSPDPPQCPGQLAGLPGDSPSLGLPGATFSWRPALSVQSMSPPSGGPSATWPPAGSPPAELWPWHCLPRPIQPCPSGLWWPLRPHLRAHNSALNVS